MQKQLNSLKSINSEAPINFDFWAYFVGLFEADGFISKDSSKWALVISGDYTQLNHFLSLGQRIGHPFSLTRGPGKKLNITWTRQNAISFISRRIKQKLGDQVVSTKIQDLYTLTDSRKETVFGKSPCTYLATQNIVLNRLVGFLEGDGGFDIEITEHRIDVRIIITQKLPEILSFFKKELIKINSDFENLKVSNIKVLDKRDGKYYSKSRLVLGPLSMKAFSQIIDFSLFHLESRKLAFKLTQVILCFKSLYQLSRIAGKSQVLSKKNELTKWNAKRFKLIQDIDLLLVIKHKAGSVSIPRLLKLLTEASTEVAIDFNKKNVVSKLTNLLEKHPLLFLKAFLSEEAPSFSFDSLLLGLKLQAKVKIKKATRVSKQQLINTIIAPLFVQNSISNVAFNNVKAPLYQDTNLYIAALNKLKQQVISLINELSETPNLLDKYN